MTTTRSRSTRTASILWRGGPVGRLTAGETMLAPRVEVRAGDFLEGEARERVRQRLQVFVRGEIERRLAPLFAAQALPLAGPARGIVFQLVGRARLLSRPRRSRRRSNRSTGQAAGRWRGWGCGSGPRRSMSSRCSAPMRSASGRCSGRCGTAGRRRSCRADADPARRSRSIRTSRSRSMPRSGGGSLPVWRCGRTGSNGWRRRPANRSRAGPFAADAELAALGGVAPDALRRVLLALGYRAVIEGDREFFVAKPRRRASDGRKRGRTAASRTRQSVCQTQGAEIRLIANDCQAPERAKDPPRPMAVVRPFREEPIAGGAAMCGRRRDDQWQRRDKAQSGRTGRRHRHCAARRLAAHGAGTRAREFAAGPASEARLLYEEAAAALRLSAVPSDWIPLLDSGETEDTRSLAAFLTPATSSERGAAYFISAMMSRKRGCSAEPSHSKTTISVVTISAPCLPGARPRSPCFPSGARRPRRAPDRRAFRHRAARARSA